jgi:L-asparaginase / beta-aspartyl-peptidase
MTESLEREYRAVLTESLRAGFRVLEQEQSCSAVDAVVAAIRVMEDSPLFNAGRGSVYGSDGRQTMDASIQRGSDRAAGAVCGVSVARNPIELAKRVFEQTPHVLLSGAGADEFARQSGVDIVTPEYFADERRLQQLHRLQQESAMSLDHDSSARISSAIEFGAPADKKFGTVGAVALDRNGHLAAGTSTGGMANKKWGRVGDSPIIGAGTFADDTVAVSCTGHGEHFIRNCIAFDVSATMRYKHLNLPDAAQQVVDKLPPACGGLIALDTHGHVAMPFNTTGMYRGYVTDDGEVSVAIFK